MSSRSSVKTLRRTGYCGFSRVTGPATESFPIFDGPLHGRIVENGEVETDAIVTDRIPGRETDAVDDIGVEQDQIPFLCPEIPGSSG